VFYATRGFFDWERELALVGEHWEMLLWSMMLFRYVYPAQSHYIPDAIWHKLLKRFEGEIGKRRPDANFRGSLVDPNMFAIDINEWGFANVLDQMRRERLSRIASIPECDEIVDPAGLRRAF
jgi:hypothetical protein